MSGVQKGSGCRRCGEWVTAEQRRLAGRWMCRVCVRAVWREWYGSQSTEVRRRRRRSAYLRRAAEERLGARERKHRARVEKYRERKGVVASRENYESWTEYSEAGFVEMVLRFGGRCVCCGQRGELSPDHVVALAVGGSHVMENIQPLCKQCNERKGARVMDFREKPFEGFVADLEELPW